MSPHFWWFLSRAAGMTALALSLLSVTTGLAISGRLSTKRLRLPWSNDLHRYLSSLTLGFLVLHVVSLAFDSYAPFGVAAMLVPGSAPFRPWAVTFGILALYSLLIIDITSRFRSKLKQRTWRMFHMFSAVVYVCSLIHALTAGPDTGLPWVRYAIVAVVVLDIDLLVRRIGRLQEAKKAPPKERSAAKRDGERPARVKAAAPATVAEVTTLAQVATVAEMAEVAEVTEPAEIASAPELTAAPRPVPTMEPEVATTDATTDDGVPAEVPTESDAVTV